MATTMKTYKIKDYCNIKCGQDRPIVCLRQSDKCLSDDEMCGPSALSGITEEERIGILEEHNKIRNNIAGGKETRGDIKEIADMNVLSYSLELEFSATCFCNACVRGKDTCPQTPTYQSVGENIAYYKYQDPKWVVNVTGQWLSQIGSHVNGPAFSGSSETQEFTQMIWSKTRFIGCSKTYKTNGDALYCCYYGPSGNVKGRPIYTVGKPCSSCDHGFTCGSSYTNLCGEVMARDHEFRPPSFSKKYMNSGVENLQVFENILSGFIVIISNII